MKVLITGTHFTPAQAVIEELKNNQDIEIVYIGRQYTREGDKSPSVESQTLPKLGVKFTPITSGRLQRSFTVYTIPSLLKIPIGFLQSFYFLLKEKPNVVLSFGGYLAVPVVFSAWLLSIPVIIHEQTLVSGLANRISSWFASKIALTFPTQQQYLGKKTILTGNPMRQELFDQKQGSKEFVGFINQARKNNRPVILITGGNQGSHVINEAVGQVLPELVNLAFLIHQTGDSKYQDFENLSQTQKKLPKPAHYLVKKWIEAADFSFLLKNVDLVVSRAGINTLLELAFFGKPALIIPLPFVSHDEQTVNANFFAQKGISKVLKQDQLTSQVLLKEIKKMLEELPLWKNNAQNAKSIVIPDAAKKLALETILMGKH